MSATHLNSQNGGLRGLLDTLWRIHTDEQSAVLGVVIATEGSTYRKPGALVLLDQTGLRHGVISGGCLEPALEDAARAVHAGGKASSVEFDTRSDEDLLFGSGTGCRGRVRLLLLPLPPRGALTRALFAVLEKNMALELSLVAEGVGGVDTDIGAGTAAFAGDTALQPRYAWDAMGRAANHVAAATLRVRIAPPPQLLLLGAGPETASLAEFARRLGWFVNVVEHRGRWVNFARAAQVDRLIELAPDAAATELVNERPDVAIVMSHNYALDLAWLRHCADSDVGYIGLLGPAARRDALLAELDASRRERLLGRLHAPVGLDLGGHGGEVVALAIAAELQQHFARGGAAAAVVITFAEHA
jgi:xanthine dehydrogenase accessory factor